jgi:hypothetical protein
MRVEIDGAFADWNSKVPIIDPLGDAYSNRTNDTTSGDVDMHIGKLASTADYASFYMSVNGTMLGGSSVPTKLVRIVTPGPPASNITPLVEPIYGADFAFVFIDTDQNSSSGFELGGSEVSLAVIGKGNQMLSSRLFRFVNDSWVDSGPLEAAIDNYQLEISSSYSSLGLLPGLSYSVTFVTEDWSGRTDELAMPLIARTTAGTRAYPGILMNELQDKKQTNDSWVELYNTGTEPISVDGWELYVDGVLVYTFPDVTILPGELYLFEDMEFDGGLNLVLVDSTGATVDQASFDRWTPFGTSWSRVGEAPYDTWEEKAQTPGQINKGQVPIPEFSDLAFSLAIIPIILFAIRRAGKRKNLKGESGGAT